MRLYHCVLRVLQRSAVVLEKNIAKKLLKSGKALEKSVGEKCSGPTWCWINFLQCPKMILLEPMCFDDRLMFSAAIKFAVSTYF